jgi:hypothetical protein
MILMLSISRRELRELRKVIQMNGQFNIVITVDAPVVGQLQLAPTQDLGPANQPLPANEALPITGGTPPYKVTNVVGTVPPGVTIEGDGTQTGTPTTAGSYPLTITLQDANG